jgi:SAM-dependent methyltransferase
MTSSDPAIDWKDWYWRWERQQDAEIPAREQRFAVMLEILAIALPDEFTLIDLMCGPGAIARRVTERFPRARVIAVDLDPVLVEMGRRAVGSADGRIRWEEADLRTSDWPARLGIDTVDAVLSTTAIHWLPAGGIVDLYRTLADVVRPGGVVLNGDQMDVVPAMPTIRRVASEGLDRARKAAMAEGAEDWDAWWQNLRQEPALAAQLAERDKRFAWHNGDEGHGAGEENATSTPNRHTHYEVHRAALLDAGFSEVDTIWQQFASRVLMAVR